MVGAQPPWWAQFGAAIIICVGVIYLMIKYLAPKLDQIKDKVDCTDNTLMSLDKSVEAAFRNNNETNQRLLETNQRLLDMLEKYIANNGKENEHNDAE